MPDTNPRITNEAREDRVERRQIFEKIQIPRIPIRENNLYCITVIKRRIELQHYGEKKLRRAVWKARLRKKNCGSNAFFTLPWFLYWRGREARQLTPSMLRCVEKRFKVLENTQSHASALQPVPRSLFRDVRFAAIYAMAKSLGSFSLSKSLFFPYYRATFRQNETFRDWRLMLLFTKRHSI